MLGILAVTFAVADHWYRLFVAMTPIALWPSSAAVSTSLDRPSGTSSGWAGELRILAVRELPRAPCLHLANDTRFRSLILLLLFSVKLNDLFAYVVGQSLGGEKLLR